MFRMSLKVLVSCPHLQRTIDNYRDLFSQNGVEIDLPEVDQNLSETDLIKIIDRYDGVIAGDDVFSEKVLLHASKLKVISKWGVGVDSIDLEAAKRLGITVSNTPNVFGDEVADLVIGYIILLSRKMHLIDRSVRNGLWKDAQIRGISLKGKTLGVIGVGSIGKAVVERAKALGMVTLGYDVYPISESFMKQTGLKQVSLVELIKNADFISLNCNLTSENRHMLGRKEFDMMKSPVYIINTARGALIEETSLIHALTEGKVAGAALDVFEHEPLPDGSPLRRFENCIFGAHNSSNTYEAILRTNELAIKNLFTGLPEGPNHE
jgi:D-3-phosphoglycerate dehydrogenase